MLANSSITARHVASGLNPSRVIVACSALTDRSHAHQSKEDQTRARLAEQTLRALVPVFETGGWGRFLVV